MAARAVPGKQRPAVPPIGGRDDVGGELAPPPLDELPLVGRADAHLPPQLPEPLRERRVAEIGDLPGMEGRDLLGPDLPPLDGVEELRGVGRARGEEIDQHRPVGRGIDPRRAEGLLRGIGMVVAGQPRQRLGDHGTVPQKPLEKRGAILGHRRHERPYCLSPGLGCGRAIEGHLPHRLHAPPRAEEDVELANGLRGGLIGRGRKRCRQLCVAGRGRGLSPAPQAVGQAGDEVTAPR